MNSALSILALLRAGERDAYRLRLFDRAMADLARLEEQLAEAKRRLAAMNANPCLAADEAAQPQASPRSP